MAEIVNALDGAGINLEELDLSGNMINKNFTYFSRYAETFIKYL
jgi:hypothetical protein